MSDTTRPTDSEQFIVGAEDHVTTGPDEDAQPSDQFGNQLPSAKVPEVQTRIIRTTR